MAERREDRRRCCVCGRKKSKTWQLVKGCNACSAYCGDWITSHGNGVCPYHKYGIPA